MGYPNTMGFRDTVVNHMYLWAVGWGLMTMPWPPEVCLRFKMPYPQLQKHMLSPMLTLNPMVLEDTMMGSRHLVKSKLDFQVWLQDVQPQHVVLQHHVVQGHHGGPRVPMVCGLRPYDHALTSRGLFEVQDASSTAVEVQVVTHVDTELHGVGRHHDWVRVLCKSKYVPLTWRQYWMEHPPATL